MKTRIATAIAAAFIASLGTAAYAQAQSTPPQPQTPPGTSSPQGMPPQTQSMSHGGMSSSNSRIERKIKHALTAHGVTATHVTVSFQSGTATLGGTVFTQADVKKAKSAAMGVRGVKHVDTSGLHAKKMAQRSSS